MRPRQQQKRTARETKRETALAKRASARAGATLGECVLYTERITASIAVKASRYIDRCGRWTQSRVRPPIGIIPLLPAKPDNPFAHSRPSIRLSRTDRPFPPSPRRPQSRFLANSLYLPRFRAKRAINRYSIMETKHDPKRIMRTLIRTLVDSLTDPPHPLPLHLPSSPASGDVVGRPTGSEVYVTAVCCRDNDNGMRIIRSIWCERA